MNKAEWRSDENIMSTKSFVPKQLRERGMLRCVIFRDAVVAVLQMVIVRVFESQIWFYRQRIVTNQFKTMRRDSLTVDTVFASAFGSPLQLATPAVFKETAQCDGH